VGREHRLHLNAAPIQSAALWIAQYRRFWEGSLDALAEYLEAENKNRNTKHTSS
jgi:hypothetical protein